jgi:hypothetical protein
MLQLWLIILEDPLPIVSVPLRDGDPDVVLDLQLALTTVYDAFRLDLTVNYQKPPQTPLPPIESVWVETQLRSAELQHWGWEERKS